MLVLYKVGQCMLAAFMVIGNADNGCQVHNKQM